MKACLLPLIIFSLLISACSGGEMPVYHADLNVFGAPLIVPSPKSVEAPIPTQIAETAPASSPPASTPGPVPTTQAAYNEPIRVDVGAGDPPRYGERRTFIPNEPYITYEQYQKIARGMSYEEVCVVFGRPGKEVNYSRTGDFSSARYRWENADGSNANIWFWNNKVTTKTNSDLR